MIFETTPSQTVGPYFAIGLPWPEGPHAVDPGDAGGDHDHRHDLRRRRRADPRPPDRDLAGRSRRPLRRPPRLRRRLGARRAFAASRATASRTATATYEIVTVKPGPGAGARTAPLQAPHIDVSLFARGMLNRVRDPDLLRRRGGGQRRRPGPRARPGRAPPDADRDARRTAATASTSASRARARRSSLTSDAGLFGGIYARGAAAARGERPRLAAGDARRRGGAGPGLRRREPDSRGSPPTRSRRRAGPTASTSRELGRAAADTPRRSCRWSRRCGPRSAEPARQHVHLGATSQDIVDTALMLIAQRALVPLLDDARAAADAAAGLAEAHRDTPMIGRTLLQQALPITVRAARRRLADRSRRGPAPAAAGPRRRAGGADGRAGGSRGRRRSPRASPPSWGWPSRCCPGRRSGCVRVTLADRSGSIRRRAGQDRPRRDAAGPAGGGRGRARAADPGARRLDRDGPQAQPGRRGVGAGLHQARARPGRHGAGGDGAGARARRRGVAGGVGDLHRAARPDRLGDGLVARAAREPASCDPERMRANLGRRRATGEPAGRRRRRAELVDRALAAHRA